MPRLTINYNVLPQSRFDLLPQSRLGVIVLGECSIQIARCLLQRQASLGENKTSARSGWSSKSKFFWNHHTKRPHGPNGLIVIPSGVPPTQFHKTLVRREWVPKNSQTYQNMIPKTMKNQLKWCKMAPKTRQGGAQRASKKQVAKKRLHSRKNYCTFSEKSWIWVDLGRHFEIDTFW